MLNAALGVGIGLLVSWGTKKITEAAQRVQNVATQSKEAADAAQSATSSLKDLVNAYEELGDKSGWDTDDFDQAKDIQAEILDLAKEQGTLDEDKLSKLNLQNGKYEEQLGLLQDITAEQLEASRYELTQNKDAQGDKLVDTAKKNNRTHYLTVWSAPEMDMGDQIKNAGIDVFNKFGGYGPDDLNDADSIIDYYNEVGKALKYVIDHTTEAERAAGGTYHSLYQFLLDEQSALRDDVDSYNDSTDAINNNTNARRKLQAIDFWSDGKSNGMDVSYSFDKVNSAIETLKNTIDDFDASKLNDLLWGTNEGLTDEQAQALAALRKALTDMDFSADTDGVNAFIQALVQVGIVAQSSANGVDALAAGAQKMEDISSKMDEIQSAYKASTSAMEEYNQYGYMSLDSLQSLLTMNTEYLNCLELVNGKLQINKQSYAELLAAEYAEAAATILSNAQHEVANLTADDTAESTDGLKEKTEAEKTALENLLPALKNATAATATYSAAQEFANEVEKAGERGVDPAKLEEITNRTNTQLSLLYTNMNAALKGGQALTNQLNGFGSSSKNAGKSSSATSKSVADLSSAFDTLTKAMKEYNQYGYISADTPTKDWSTDDAKRLHVGDIYYDCNEEKAYTWTDEYEWLTADDENLLKILKIVSKESDTADGSRRVFFNTPSPPYSKGDVWADYSFNGYMLVCQVSRPISASYNRLDWVVASKYTDDTKADEALDSANKANADLATFKTEYDSDLKVTKEQIEARVTATTYTEDMSSLKKRVSTAESRITQTEKDITLRVEKDDYTGEKLVSMISAQPESVKISAKNIELTGAVTIQNGQTVLNSESVNNSITQIDGGKITTGTIDANRLNLSGGLTIGSGGSITIGNNTISADKLASGSVFKELWRNYEETEYKVGTFSFDNSQTQYNELLFFFRGLFKNGKVDDSQEGTITHVEQVPTGNTDSYGNPEYETKTIIDSKIRIETYYTSTNTMVVPLITNSTIWYHTFFSYPSAYFVRQWEHYKVDPSQNIIQGTYKEGMSFNTDVVDNMDYQWCNSNIMRYFSVSVSQNNTVTVTFKNAFRYTTKKGFWDDSGKVSIYPNYAIPRIIYGIK